jgi:hypothetical protein
LIWAHFRRFAPETGLSACIFFACDKKGYRFNPLRVRREELFSKSNDGKGPAKRMPHSHVISLQFLRRLSHPETTDPASVMLSQTGGGGFKARGGPARLTAQGIEAE